MTMGIAPGFGDQRNGGLNPLAFLQIKFIERLLELPGIAPFKHGEAFQEGRVCAGLPREPERARPSDPDVQS